jgi:archaetidylinositol phosphate synthase
MPKRVSHSLLDPYLTLPIKRIYSLLRPPAWLPPEAIVLVGHLAAIAGAIGFAFADRWWWAGLLGAAGVAGNHTADVLDGTHARATGQCRNGGELLDHFVDPLSFSYWVAAMSYCADNLLLGIGGVIVIYATAVLTNIRAKMIGEFALARFGPTEFKSLLVLFGLAMAGIASQGWSPPNLGQAVAFWFVFLLFVAGLLQLKWSLYKAVRDVNAAGSQPDTTEWEIRD